jgi:hypothetical protein
VVSCWAQVDRHVDATLNGDLRGRAVRRRHPRHAVLPDLPFNETTRFVPGGTSKLNSRVSIFFVPSPIA